MNDNKDKKPSEVVAEVNRVVIPKSCPFCGGTSVFTSEGSTFRWWVAGCNECGAQAGEVRRQTLGDGTNEEWDEAARIEAIEAWNERKG